MSAPARLAIFAVVIAAAFGAAALAGAAIDPTDSEPAAASHGSGRAGPAAGGHGGMASMGGAAMSGLTVEKDGFALQLEDPVRKPGQTTLRFRILGADGEPLTSGFELQHEKRLHLIVVRRDTSVFRHLHPTMAPDGTWTAQADLPDAGDYRVFTDFQRDGEKTTLATDLFLSGEYAAQAWPAPAPEATTDTGGLQVRLSSGTVQAGEASELRFDVTRDGKPFTAIEPYLGAEGHLVALREGDLGYLHVHPMDGAADDNRIAFEATFPSAGRYRLFLQLKTGGEVRTVSYTLEVKR